RAATRGPHERTGATMKRNVLRAGILATATLATLLAAGATPTIAAFPGVNGRIAFDSDRTGGEQIYTIEADGSDLKQLTTVGANNNTPRPSPDGRKILFNCLVGGNP